MLNRSAARRRCVAKYLPLSGEISKQMDVGGVSGGLESDDRDRDVTHF